MKALLYSISSCLFKWRKAPASSVESTETENTLDFERLPGPAQAKVQQYFYAAARLMQLVNSIRNHKRAIDVDQLLIEFRDAERLYALAGLRPFFPPAIQSMTEFTPAQLAKSKLLSRLDPNEKVQMYSPAMDRYVDKLIRDHHACELESSAVERLFHE